MPTRADYYLNLDPDFYPTQGGSDKPMTWLGSTGFDGDPISILTELAVLQGSLIMPIVSEADWCESVTALLQKHEEATHPDWGWPWPWDTSTTTDYAYAYDLEAGLMISEFGHPWRTVEQVQALVTADGRYPVFPNMSAIMSVRWDAGNAPMIIGERGVTNPPVEAKNYPKSAPL